MNSPIKYYGGKTYLTETLLKNFPTTYEIYIEAFGGGASLLFAKDKTSLEMYNDLDKNVYSLFKVLNNKDMFNRFKERLELTYYHNTIREEFKSLLQQELSIEDRAYYFFYVNRTSFNGIGGFSKTMLVRRNMSKSVSDFLSSIDKLPEIHNRLSEVIVDNKDVFDLLEQYNQENVFIYLDPPYVHSTRKSNTKYNVEMSDEQHVKLVDMLLNFKGKFLLSGYNHEIYNRLTDKFNKFDFRSPEGYIETLWKNYNNELTLFDLE
jgi:DNA adenine methylase